MDLIKHPREEKHPFVQLIFLGLLAILGTLVFAVLAMIIIYFTYGMDVMMNVLGQKLNLTNSASAFKILLTAQQLGLFLIPAILLGVTESKKPHHFYGLANAKIPLLGIVFLLMLFSVPLFSLINEWNLKMHLPSFLNKLESWMKRMEAEGMKTTMAILKMKSIGGLLVNIFVIAVVPAVCEEFLFRGALQRTLRRWFANPHIAIWVAAAIFSAIHFQFYGFFTRMFLGASFGYIYLWTGSLWYTIFAHFLNNAYAVVVAYYLQLKNLPINANDDISVAWYGYLISAILTLVLFWVLKDQATKGRASNLSHI